MKEYTAPKAQLFEIFTENSLANGSQARFGSNSSSINVDDWTNEDGFDDNEYVIEY